VTTTRSYRIKPAQVYTLPGAQDERRALIDEISRMYRRYFERDVRPALLAAWSEKSADELRRMREQWATVKGHAPTIAPQARVRNPVIVSLFD